MVLKYAKDEKRIDHEVLSIISGGNKEERKTKMAMVG